MVFLSSIRRRSEQWTTLLLPDFVEMDHFHLNIFFPTLESLYIHIFVMWKPIENSVFLWTFCNSQTTLLKWIAVLRSVTLYVILYIHLQTSPLKKISKCWLNLKALWADRKKCKSSLFTRMCLYEHEDQRAMFKAKRFRSILREYQSILLLMLMEVAQRSETERYEHKSRVPVNLTGNSLLFYRIQILDWIYRNKEQHQFLHLASNHIDHMKKGCKFIRKQGERKKMATF